MKKLNFPYLTAIGRIFWKQPALMDVAKSFVYSENKHRQWSKRTLENYQILIKHYRGYEPKAEIRNIDEEWTDNFVTYLYDKGLRNSTIGLLLQEQRAVLKWAANEGYDVQRCALHYCPRLKNVNNPSNVVALTPVELTKLLELEIESSSLRASRDIFCFCCLTSLRYSDVKQLKWCNIVDGWIELISKKTSEPLHIPLNSQASAIIRRYKRSTTKNTDKVLPVVSCVNYNQNIKKIAQMAGLNRMITKVWFVGAKRHESSLPLHQVISSHVGRKTFVTLALSSGMPADVLCSFTGHKDSRQLKHYYNITREEQTRWMLHLGGKCDGKYNN